MNALTRIEEFEFAQLEEVIARGQESFLEVGEALSKIRDGRLYRKYYGTFQEYCEERWSWGASRARQLIAAVAVAESIKCVTRVTLPDEAAARELGKLPVEQRAEIIREAAKTGAPTASAIREEVNKRKPMKQAKVTTAKPEKIIDIKAETVAGKTTSALLADELDVAAEDLKVLSDDIAHDRETPDEIRAVLEQWAKARKLLNNRMKGK